ncbi:MAG TPA: malto-oligosyltrehalose trehalohydrolase [Pseudonocardiaceae bacterium]|jgi:maltooligosyltrehalose trehalohydrolase|nr:malto-oligosyltrehalose trehalohydrolase [Pseudonocardiaceae bacterium]
MPPPPVWTPAVWAPQVNTVRVRVDDTDHAMTRDDNGWWSADVAASPHCDYAFLLDDDPKPLPDPRSRWQPNGVHAASRRYVPAEQDWPASDWTGRQLAGGIVYELHIGTFTEEGTLAAAIGKLDHLVELGIDFVELMPVNAFDGVEGWGYDGVAWYAVHEPYGGPAGLRHFVAACHDKGLGVILDVVYNHLGPSGAYLDRFGPYFAGSNQWGRSLNLDGPDSDEVRRYVIDNALGWLREFHLDGLRLDAVHALHDSSATHLLEQLAIEVDALSTHLGRPLTLIAESDLNDAKLVTAREAGGYGLTAQWDDDLHHVLHAALTGERQGYYVDFGSLESLAKTWERVFFHAGTYSTFRHRTHGRPVDTQRLPAHRFLAYVQDHDQIGNRATGDRISATLSPGLLGVAAAMVLCSPYTPMIFMGEEWGSRAPWQFFASFPDPELANSVRTGRRAEFADHGWATEDVPDPMDPATVVRSRLCWSELDDPAHQQLLGVYRRLIAARRTHPELSDPRLPLLKVEFDEERRWLIVHRGSLRLACNLAGEHRTLPIGSVDVVLANGSTEFTADAVTLAPESFALLRVRD